MNQRLGIYFLCCVVFVLAYEQLTSESLAKIPGLTTGKLNLDNHDPRNHLKHFNITRVPSSKGSKIVQDYIISHFESLNSKSNHPWLIQKDNFFEKGFNFTNIIVTKKPDAGNTDYLVLAAHYDSKIQPEGFIGAIDSAVSCGILLDVAESVTRIFDEALEKEEYALDVGLKIVFFDGEEAFERWTAADSIYGSRHLHSVWSKSGELRRIELFILLDLLGSIGSNYVPSYFPQSHESYNDLSTIESRLIQTYPELFKGLQSKYLQTPVESFQPEFEGYMEDDHIPFLRSGIPVLHLIPRKFPETWHTIDDDFNHVDIDAINRWSFLLKAFVLEYLELQIC